MQQFEDLKALIATTEVDVQKFNKGNKAAGVRVRKAMLSVKKVAQSVREGVLEAKEA
ncbi:histone H1 [Siphonobacter sp. SORGH_AS_0500]|uniref:histone H1 n=1 Tax=Siphonobacter sp. SORGH_AS_0500 TaxID=1864824 RepID=UPI0028668FDE|nr:histone H1 [Siphonobacter sp. SORGH_AS_0500]MDR6194745.1 hypothetical protein [Siphonobacter sp. SORGH_AS_0500]